MPGKDSAIIIDSIKREMRKDQLDAALLFIISSFGLVFSIIQVLLSGIVALLYILPPLIIGFVLPFWYGYLQGAVFQDQPIIRAKGWTYLFFGAFAYSSFLIPTIVGKSISSPFWTAVIWLAAAVGFLTISPISGTLPKKVLEMCGRTISDLDEVILLTTAFAGSFLLVSSAFWLLLCSSFSYELLLTVATTSLWGALFELMGRRYVKKYGEQYEANRKELRSIDRAAPFILLGAIFFWVLVVVLLVAMLVEPWYFVAYSRLIHDLLFVALPIWLSLLGLSGLIFITSLVEFKEVS